MKFTDRYLQSVKPREIGYRINEGHGFCLRVLPSDSKIFQLIYTVEGKRRYLNLGQYPSTSLADARDKFHEAMQAISKGVDPQDKSARMHDPTVADLIDMYLAHKKEHLVDRSIKHQTRTLMKDVLPVLGKLRVADVRRRDAILLIEDKARKTPGQARNVLLNSRSMFSYALQREMIEYNPFAGVSAAVPKVVPKPRERVLSHDEIRLIWKKLWTGDNTSFLRRAILLAFVTGQRPGEVVTTESHEIEVGVGKPLCASCRGCGWWTIPPEKSHKNPDENRVYLTRLALQLLVPIKGHLFPAQRGDTPHLVETSLGTHVSSRHKYFGLEKWTPHDLRRTAATQIASLGAHDEIIDAILGHRKQGIVATYNRYRYDVEKEQWLTDWAKHLIEIISK
jgi:integrase